MAELAFGIGMGLVVVIVLSFLAMTGNRPPQ